MTKEKEFNFCMYYTDLALLVLNHDINAFNTASLKLIRKIQWDKTMVKENKYGIYIIIGLHASRT